MGLDIKGQLLSYFTPLALLLAAVFFHIVTILDFLLLRRHPTALLDHKTWRDISFSKLWTALGPSLAASENATIVPSLVVSAHGVVLELGPGSGEQIHRYDMEKVERVVGVEPNVHLHGALRANAERAGLGGRYTVVGAGIEDAAALRAAGVEPGTVDCVVCVKVLCCVPQPQEMIRRCYTLLRPGGEMIVFEHVRSRYRWPRVLENAFNVVWPHMLAGCNLNRPTDEWLVQAGLEWERVELRPPVDEKWFAVIPHICGRLVKPR